MEPDMLREREIGHAKKHSGERIERLFSGRREEEEEECSYSN